jgi:hypothetical protein
MAQAGEKVPIRSYRGVIDNVERRIFRIDRWRLPTPHGLSVRALTYTVASLMAVLLVGRLPIAGTLLGLLPVQVRLLALPVFGGWLLSTWAPDGRAPHHALISALRYFRAPKHLAGLRPCPALGEQLVPVCEVQVAAGVDGPAYRPGVITGPARVTLRYPASVAAEGVPRRYRNAEPGEQLAHARCLVVTPASDSKPLARGKTLQLPEGKELRFG